MTIPRSLRFFRATCSRRALARAVGAALALSLSSASLQTLVANGDTRSLTFGHIHTKETLTVTYKRTGRYDPEALRQINWFLRDWRTDEPTRMDPYLFDILWEVHRETGARGPIMIVSGYRSPQTNSMLRSRGRGVAQYSLHMSGKAIDFFIPGADLAALRAAGLRLERGGVGYYPASGAPFIHVDTGGVRHWPRMTREQLVQVFPDGKTVHLPSDGRPLPGFALAQAALDAREAGQGTITLVAAPARDAEEPEHTASTRPAAAARAPARRLPEATAVAVAKPPLPAERPSDLDSKPASLPVQVAAAGAGVGRALGYAAEPERRLPTFGSLPAAHTRLVRADAPVQAPASTPTFEAPAEIARQQVGLLSTASAAHFGELTPPETALLRGLVEPARAALRVQFSETVQAPASSTFAGPAVITLPTVAFDRGAGIVIGRIAPRGN